MVEYGLMVALIALVCIAAVAPPGTKTSSMFSRSRKRSPEVLCSSSMGGFGSRWANEPIGRGHPVFPCGPPKGAPFVHRQPSPWDAIDPLNRNGRREGETGKPPPPLAALPLMTPSLIDGLRSVPSNELRRCLPWLDYRFPHSTQCSAFGSVLPGRYRVAGIAGVHRGKTAFPLMRGNSAEHLVGVSRPKNAATRQDDHHIGRKQSRVTEFAPSPPSSCLLPC